MPVPALVLMLCMASLSATWNALVKGAENKLYMTILLTLGAGLLGLAVLPFVGRPAPASWPFIAMSAGCSVVYYVLVAEAYHVADMSATYPLMRGTAPLLVALASRTALGERLSVPAWAGVALICVGILGLALSSQGRSAKGVALALANAAVIAVYTLIDGRGSRLSNAPVAYGMWVYILTSVPLVAWALIRNPGEFARFAVRNWPSGALGACLGVAVYSTTLWAMTLAPVAVVAALRETSILFAVAISAFVLKERVGPRRAVLACAIAGGAMVLRLA
jgi:drug/metabolite transporter (DMT)-like permease